MVFVPNSTDEVRRLGAAETRQARRAEQRLSG
jgi:hypothetical protein